MDETTSRLKFENDGDDEEYEVKAIRDNAIYAKELDSGHHLSGLYYLVSWKGYSEEENTWEPISAVLYFRKLISTFHHDHLDKLTATSPLVDSAPPIARPTMRPAVRPKVSSTKQKHGRTAIGNGTSKRAKKS